MKRGRRIINFAIHELNEQKNIELKEDEENENKSGQILEEGRSYWIPHERTGIYYPLGYEYVMKDIPKGAASFGGPYWLRETEGVEKSASNDTCNEIFNHPFLDV
ncbi:hypothetical protein KSP40_PGU022771 [Platanthera guangdongensis]|uniref:Uncharacterized protein n=1 Tax=Platanthera guangdongensis TaxID=2320717 RepID=A0ABR2MGK7_9ASPA